ncbi:hypothetical protein AAC387_Pa07g0004 [Persea americana]
MTNPPSTPNLPNPIPPISHDPRNDFSELLLDIQLTQTPVPQIVSAQRPEETSPTQGPDMIMEIDKNYKPRSFRAALCPTSTSIIQALSSSIEYWSAPPLTQVDSTTPVVLLEESLLADNR